jgi:hypothetical protein
LIYHFFVITILVSQSSLSLVTCSQYCNHNSFNQTQLDSSWIRKTNPETLPNSWRVDETDYKAAPSSLGTGQINYAGYYNITKNIVGPGYVTFYWKKTRYPYEFSRLYFVVDGKKRKIYINSKFEWEKITEDFDKGPHNLTWVFQMEMNWQSKEIAQAWIDEIYICQEAPPSSDTIRVNNMIDLYENINNTRIKTIILEPNLYEGTIDINNAVSKTLRSEYPHLAKIASNKLYVIGIDNSADIHIENLSITGSEGGIYLQGSSLCEISGTNIDVYSHNGIDLDDSVNNIIKNNVINKHGSENCMIRLRNNSNLNTIMNNDFIMKSPDNCFLISLEHSCQNYIFNIHSGDVLENGIRYIINNSQFITQYQGCNLWWWP